MNTTSSLKYKKCVNNMDELEGQSYRTGKCICLWKECHSWTAFFASKKHHLGSMVKMATIQQKSLSWKTRRGFSKALELIIRML
jgi:hypothetical protein